MNKMMITLFTVMFLTSCASVNSKFDCPMKRGVRCESLDAVNAKVDRGEIGHDDELKSQSFIKRPARHVEDIHVSSYDQFRQRKPLRYGETVQHIWIAPFEDTSGNYHQENDVYTIVKPGHWIGNPLKEKLMEE